MRRRRVARGVPAHRHGARRPLSGRGYDRRMTPPALSTSSVLAVGVRKTPDGPRLAGPAAEALAPLEALLPSLGITGAADETSRQLAPESVAAATILLVGLGAEPTVDARRSERIQLPT